MTDLSDPFANPDDIASSFGAIRKKIISGGRYRLPCRDGSHKSYGWQRVTNLVGAYSDQYALRVYEIGAVLQGLKDAPELFDEVANTDFASMSKVDRRDWVEKFTERAKDAAKANEGRDFGNLRHAQVEADHAGLPLGAVDAHARKHLGLYRAALVRHKLRALPGMQERRVLVEELDAIGTLDNVLEDLVTGLFHIADLKTIKRFWTFLEIAAQLACYARAGAMWEPSTTDDPLAGRWVDMPKVDLAIGHVLWMPREHPSGISAVDVYDVDIMAGWETAQLARKIVLDRAGGKGKRDPRGWKRGAPIATLTEKFAARFAAVDTIEDGGALVREAKAAGVWSPILADCATEAKARITREKVR